MITDGEYINGSFLRQIMHLHFDKKMNDELNLMRKKENRTYGHYTKYFAVVSVKKLMMKNSSLQME
jgi:hypothetical protein